jgi:quercetin dioxygenase-like cupin family protein
MSVGSFEAFTAAAHAEGFDEVVARTWEANQELPLHTHPFAVRATVIDGEMWLTVGEETRHLQPGDSFELDNEQAHAERYGPKGATYWVARRHGH